MLKIKFNINEFTIIFQRRFEGKNERKRISFSLYQLQHPLSYFSVSFLLQPPFLFSSASFSFQFQRLFLSASTPPLLFSSASLFLFFRCVALFLAQNTFSAQNVFQPKILFQPKTFFSPKNLSLFVVQRLLLFFLFSASFLSFNVLPFFPSLVQPSIFQPKKNSLFSPKPFSVQPKTFFFCACLLLFYLNKSSFSSNLQ